MEYILSAVMVGCMIGHRTKHLYSYTVKGSYRLF